MKNHARIRLFIFPSLALLLFTAIILDNINLFAGGNSIALTYFENLKKGNGGYGEVAHYRNGIPLKFLQPGDILLGGWPNCAYGAFSHAGLYLGNGEVLEGYVDTGITINSVNHYQNYAQACILRVQTSQAIKNRVIKYARRQEGKIFYPLAFKNGERYWNCSKIIWKAYMNQNIDLDNSHDLWIAPIVFYTSPLTETICIRGEIRD